MQDGGVLRWMRVVIALCLTLVLGVSTVLGEHLFKPSLAFAPGAGLVVLVFAYGWPRLTDSPQPRATSIMLALLGAAGLSATVLAEAEPFLEWLPTLVGIGLLWAFVQNLSRGMGATHATANVSAQVAGVAIILSAATWVATFRLTPDHGTILAGLVAVVLALAATALPWPARYTSPLAIAAGAAGGLIVALILGDVASGLVLAGVLGAIMGVLAAAVDRLLGLVAQSKYQSQALSDSTRRDKARLFAVHASLGAAPIALGGVIVYVLTRVAGV